MRQTMLMAIGLLCLAACATDSKNVAATGESQPDQAQAGEPVPAEGSAQSEPEAHASQAASEVAETSEDPEGATEAGNPAGATTESKTETKPEGPPTTHTTKPAAPVDVVCTPKGDTIHLSVKFLGNARDVRIDVWGTDGLEVRGETRRIQAQAYERGAIAELEIPFEAPDNARSYLAIQVSGRFGDRDMGTVRACTIHPEYPDQDNVDADIRVDEQGRKIRVVHPD